MVGPSEAVESLNLQLQSHSFPIDSCWVQMLLLAVLLMLSADRDAEGVDLRTDVHYNALKSGSPTADSSNGTLSELSAWLCIVYQTSASAAAFVARHAHCYDSRVRLQVTLANRCRDG